MGIHMNRFQHGQGMTEYIIIVALIAIAAIAVYQYFGNTVRNQTAAVANELAGNDGTAAKTAAQAAATTAAGAALALPGDVPILGLLPWACGVATNTAVAMAFGAITFACRVPLAVRLTLVLPSLWVLQEWLLGLPAWSIPWVRLGYMQ